MSDTDDLPPSDFVEWMSAQAPELATAGKKIARRERIRPWRIRRSRARLVPSGGRRPGNRRWAKTLLLVLVVGVVLSLSFVGGWLHPAGNAAPSGPGAATDAATYGNAPSNGTGVSPASPAPLAGSAAFPATIAGAGTTFERLAVSDPGGCDRTATVSAEFRSAIESAGPCRSIQVALYVDASTRIRVAVCVVDMVSGSAAANLIPVLSLTPPGAFGFLPSPRRLPPGDGQAYSGGLSLYDAYLVLDTAEFMRGVPRDIALLNEALQTVDAAVAQSLGAPAAAPGIVA